MHMRHAALAAVGVLGLATGIGASLSAAQAAGYTGPCQAVFISPHQDDEVLSMGAAIRQHVEALGGDKVCVTLFTTGLHSNTKAIMRAGSVGAAQYAGWIPAGQTSRVTYPGLTDAQFVSARDKEFIAAVTALGVPASNIYVNGYTLGGVTYPKATQNEIPGVQRVFDDNDGNAAQQARAATFVNAVITHFGSSKDYKTQSPNDSSGDHSALGIALRDTGLSVQSKRYYYPPYQRSLPNDDGIKLYVQEAATPSALVAAGNAYGLYAPTQGRYGVGWLSVGNAFGGNAFSVKVCVPGATGPTCGAAEPLARAGDTPYFTAAATVKNLSLVQMG